MRLSLILELTKRDFAERYSGSMLGVAWSVIWPMVHIAIYIVIFGKLMGARLPGSNSAYGYSIYLMAGLIPWTAFANTVQRSSTAFIDKRSIISKIDVSLPMFPAYIVLSETVTFLVMAALFLGFLYATGGSLPRAAVVLPLVFMAQQILAYALGFLAATAGVFLRDVKEIVGIGLQVWFWMTPIVYLDEILPEFVARWMRLNPAFLFVDAWHAVLVRGELPGTASLMALALAGHGVLLLAYVMFRRYERVIRDFI